MLKNISFHRVAYTAGAALIVSLVVYVKMLENAVQQAHDSQHILPPGVTNKVIIKDRIVTVVKKVKGDTVVKKVYVPVEGSATVVVSTQTGKPEVDVVFKTKGLCFRPGLTTMYDRDTVIAGLDAKIGYWSRFSAGTSLTTRSLNWWVSYHLDQLPYWHPQNLEGFLGRSAARFDGAPNNWQIGLRLNF